VRPRGNLKELGLLRFARNDNQMQIKLKNPSSYIGGKVVIFNDEESGNAKLTSFLHQFFGSDASSP